MRQLFVLAFMLTAASLTGCDKLGLPSAPKQPTTAPAVVLSPRTENSLPPAGTPQRTVQDFHDALQSGDISNLRGIVAYDLATIPPLKVREPLREAARQLSNDVTDFRIVETKVDTDCAAVVVHVNVENGKPSNRGIIEPYLLVQQNGMWRLLPLVGKTQDTKLTPEQKQAFTRLGEWFWKNKSVLITKAQAMK